MAGVNSGRNSIQLEDVYLENSIENPNTDLVIVKLDRPFDHDYFNVYSVTLPNSNTPPLKRT